MPTITLPDGSTRSFDVPVTGAELAASIGAGLARSAIGMRVDGELRDLATALDHDAKVAIITAPRKDQPASDDALMLLRHSAAHVMAEAIQRLFPGVELVYGPALESGFYYDMRVPDERPLSSEDFDAIEREMSAIIAEERRFTRYELPVPDGMRRLENEGSKYKLDNARRAVEAGSATLTWYATGTPGTDWEDLCRGPHLPTTKWIGGFKIMSLASAYWHGDATSDRLTRVYGTAFFDPAALAAHLEALEEARRRDHRVIGRQLGLFHIDDMVGQGLILWTPAGAIIRQELQSFISEELRRQGYQQVFTPNIGKLDLYRTSGHFPYYRESQYPPIVAQEVMDRLADEKCSCADLAQMLTTGDIDGYMLKPMNCPHHIRIFASKQHSYRDLPVRYAEFGTVYRWEQSGELNGMTRVRGFTQDDAHLFCTEDQVGAELLGCLDLVRIIFRTLDMHDYRVRVGLRDPNGDKYVGDPANWDKAETACREAARSLGVPFTEEPGEAAFYGPKIDFVVRDVVGREWQLGTIQVDYNLPERFELSYIGADNQPHRPVMIHRAPFGSMERFIGVLIEHFAGAFPTWLSPEQVRVLPISDKSAAWADDVHGSLLAAGVRASCDHSSDRIQAKIRNATSMKIPYLFIVGPRDADQKCVSVRARGFLRDLGAITLDAAAGALTREISSRGRESLLSLCFPGTEPATTDSGTVLQG